MIETLSGYSIHARVDGLPINFTRRRYGTTIYTWVKYHDGEQWVDLGDPWPSPHVPVKELRESIKLKRPA